MDIEYKALHTFIVKGVSTKARAREALENLTDLLGDLQDLRDELEEGLSNWEEGEDPETRAEGRDTVERVALGLDYPMTQAGLSASLEV